MPTRMNEVSAPQAALMELRRQLSAGLYDDKRLPPERELAATLGISRRALRLALDTLEEEKLIWRRQGHGTFASAQSMVSDTEIARLAHRVNPLEMIEARLAIEPLLVRRAAIRASRAEIAAITKLAESGRDARDARSYEAYDIAFHRKIAECAGNAMLLAMFEMVGNVRQRADWRQVREYNFDHEGAAQTYAEHRRIIEGLEAQDAAAAEQAMREHLQHVARNALGLADLPPGLIA